MKSGVSRALLCAAFLLPAFGRAQESAARPESAQFNYTYVQVSYDETDFDVGPLSLDGDGLTLSGSFELTDEWHIYTSYSQIDLDPGNADVDTWAIGAGYVFPLKDGIDLYGRVLYIDQNADAGAASIDDDGLAVQGRIRARITDEFELEGGIQYVDVSDSDISLQASARYNFTEQFSAGIGISFAGDTDGIGINARYSF
jgi:hypothetical protein